MPPNAGRPAYPAEHHMVTSITIRNFRSFGESKIEDFRRVNILVGDNGSGKTALLEALFLAAGVTPELVLRTRTWRGLEGGRVSGTREEVHQALWADLFHNFETTKPALVSLKGTGEENRSVTVRLYRRGQVRAVPPRRDKPGAPVKVVPEPSPIEFRWRVQGHPDITVTPTFEGENLVFPPIPESYVRAAFFASTRVAPPSESANRFSQLSRKFLEQEFIDQFTKLYANIPDLSVELSAGTAMLFARVSGIPEKIPLASASGGMSKLAGILLAMPEQAGGLILIDELENGLFHRRLPIIWKTLLEFSRYYRCQLFISTHSAECLDAATRLAQEHPEEFAIIRTYLVEGKTQFRRLSGDKFVAAMEEQMDVR